MSRLVESRAMTAVALALFVAAHTLGSGQVSGQIQSSPVTIGVGDVVKVSIIGVDEAQSLTVMEDGAVSGVPFGNVKIAGLTVDQASHLLAEKSKKYIVNPAVFVTIDKRKETFLTVVAANSGTERVPWTKSTDLRSVLAIGDVGKDTDKLEVHLFRQGNEILVENVEDLLSGSKSSKNPLLLPDDVVTIALKPTLRIWVTSGFNAPGPIQMYKGATLSDAVASAGGFLSHSVDVSTLYPPEYDQKTKLQVIRGGQVTEFNTADVLAMSKFELQAGDTLSVRTPLVLKVDIAGQVIEPGPKSTLDEATLLDIVVKSKGPTQFGTLKNVLVFRGADVYQVDLTAAYSGKTEKRFPIKNGDLILVQENKAFVTVIGDVRQPGKYPVKDDETVHLSDALTKAGGLLVSGTLRRVMIARPNSDGKFEVKEVDLDAFLKGGDGSANPLLQPGDFVLFSQAKVSSGETFLRLLPLVYVLPTIIK